MIAMAKQVKRFLVETGMNPLGGLKQSTYPASNWQIVYVETGMNPLGGLKQISSGCKNSLARIVETGMNPLGGLKHSISAFLRTMNSTT